MAAHWLYRVAVRQGNCIFAVGDHLYSTLD
jgi:hypothetical protein